MATKKPWAGLTFTVSSGPAFVMTFLGVMLCVFKLKPPFNEAWIALVTLFGLHTGKRLWQKIKGVGYDINANGNCENGNGEVTNGTNGQPPAEETK